ncbi:MAG: hypothetical protein IPL61_00475 [Myxococcales bacterium]|nr:hypothetical protein [Myxococcales bacterium]
MRAIGLGVALAVAASAGGCSGPYAGSPEKLKRPSKKPEPEEVPVDAVEIKMVMECQAKFQEEPKDALKMHKRNATASSRLVDQADTLLDDARGATDDKARAAQTVEAINKLRKALLDAPYHAEATYKLAHAYALTRRQGCAVALLKRLNDLQRYGDFAAEAKRKIDEAEGDSVFQPFRKQANEAINR